MKSRNRVFVNSMKHCFVCLNQFPEYQNKRFSRFWSTVEYLRLDLDLTQFTNQKDPVVEHGRGAKLMVELCERCQRLNREIYLTFEVMMKAQKKLKSFTRELYQRMVGANQEGKENGFKALADEGDESTKLRHRKWVNQIEMARRETVLKCNVKLTSRREKNPLRGASLSQPGTNSQARLTDEQAGPSSRVVSSLNVAQATSGTSPRINDGTANQEDWLGSTTIAQVKVEVSPNYARLSHSGSPSSGGRASVPLVNYSDDDDTENEEVDVEAFSNDESITDAENGATTEAIDLGQKKPVPPSLNTGTSINGDGASSSSGSKVPCPTCGKLYSRDYLRKHIKSVHLNINNNIPCQCQYCNKSYNRMHNLKLHQFMKHGIGNRKLNQ